MFRLDVWIKQIHVLPDKFVTGKSQVYYCGLYLVSTWLDCFLLWFSTQMALLYYFIHQDKITRMVFHCEYNIYFSPMRCLSFHAHIWKINIYNIFIAIFIIKYRAKTMNAVTAVNSIHLQQVELWYTNSVTPDLLIQFV